MNKNYQKTTINIPNDTLAIIDEAVANIPFMKRSQFMIDCTLKCINDNKSISMATKGNLMPHVAELSNLVNALENNEQKTAIQKEVMCIWQSLN